MTAAGEGTGVTVLVVDDDPFMRDVLAEMLAQLGVASTCFAEDGDQALEVVSGGAPIDLILCDLDMGGMDGIQLLRHLGDRNFAGAICVVSGAGTNVRSTAADLARLHGLRLLSTLAKPVDAEELRRMLEGLAQPAGPRHRAGEVLAHARILDAEEIRHGIAEGRVEIHVQPKVTVVDRRVVGVEALLRWRDLDGTILPPSSVVPVAEHNGLVNALTLAVFRRALEAMVGWRQEGLDVRLSVNLSRENLDTLSLPDSLADLARQAGIDTASVTLEISQTGMLDDRSVGMEVVGRLRLKGFGIAIDDYGLGYSILGQLKNLPVTELKVDRSFVEGAEADSTLTQILSSSASLGRSLGLSVVAQGVETAEVMQLLESLGCDEMQGYLVARPMPVADFPEWKRRWDRTWRPDEGTRA